MILVNLSIFSTKYRDWGDITAEHLVVLVGLLFMMMLAYGVVRKRRSAQTHAAVRKLSNNSNLLQSSSIPKKQYFIMLKEFIRIGKLQKAIEPQDAGAGDPGWGLDERVHFNTSIAKSFVVIDEAVSVTRPGLRSRSYRTIREYISALSVEFPAISENTTKHYIEWYEKARFSDYKFSEQEYNDFMKTVLEILDAIQ